jgi:hypothetical protein
MTDGGMGATGGGGDKPRPLHLVGAIATIAAVRPGAAKPWVISTRLNAAGGGVGATLAVARSPVIPKKVAPSF